MLLTLLVPAHLIIYPVVQQSFFVYLNFKFSLILAGDLLNRIIVFYRRPNHGTERRRAPTRNFARKRRVTPGAQRSSKEPATVGKSLNSFIGVQGNLQDHRGAA